MMSTTTLANEVGDDIGFTCSAEGLTKAALAFPCVRPIHPPGPESVQGRATLLRHRPHQQRLSAA